MTPKFTLVLGAIVALVSLAAPAAQAAGWGVEGQSAPRDQLTRTQQDMGRPYRSFSVYDGLNEGAEFPKPDARAAMRAGATIFLNITSMRALADGTKVPYCWSDVARRRYDYLLQRWTAALHAADYPDVIVTFQHEPELGSNAQQPKCAGSTATVYRAAFERVWHFFRGHNIEYQFAFVAVAVHFETPGRVDPWVPWGYFHFIGVDGYCHVQHWLPPVKKYGGFAAWLRARAPRRPVILPEFGVDARGPDAGTMLTRYATYFQETFGPRLVLLNWSLKRPLDVYTPEIYGAFLAASRWTYYGG